MFNISHCCTMQYCVILDHIITRLLLSGSIELESSGQLVFQTRHDSKPTPPPTHTCTQVSFTYVYDWHIKVYIDELEGLHCVSKGVTVETLYSTIYNSKYFIELNIDKSTQYVALWTHKRHPIPRPFGRAMECLLWVLQQKLVVL